MKTLEVTDEQYACIQYLREEISESVVGKYGFVRERDAVQFLIDNLDGEIELDADEFDSSATDDVAASVGAAIDGDDDPHELEEVSYIEDEATGDEQPDDDADRESGVTDATATDDESVEDDSETDDGDDELGIGSDAADRIETDVDTGATTDSTDDDTDASGSTDDDSSGNGSADDDDMLNEMMSLLETHDDKWQESSSADYRYAVDLPDGSTEQVQTKDDVRALLFKNYR